MPVAVTINSCKQRAACTVDDLVEREPAGTKKGTGLKAEVRGPGPRVYLELPPKPFLTSLSLRHGRLLHQTSRPPRGECV